MSEPVESSSHHLLALKAFLSHRYRSPKVNLYFHKVFEEEAAEVQFEVDVGSTPINVTRLERMVRDCDAFIGIYAFPGDPMKRATAADLRTASQYFRLECDLAIRSKRPALVFFDQRYAQLFGFPQSIRAESFDVQEVSGGGGSPKRARFRKVFGDFCEEVQAAIERSVSRPGGGARPEVGVLVPDTGPAKSRYRGKEIDCIREVLSTYGYRHVTVLPWPPSLRLDYLTALERFDWMIVDIGEPAMNTGIIGYLHGRLMPTIRLVKGFSHYRRIQNRRAYKALYGGVEVGYAEDIVAWDSVPSLEKRLTNRIAVLTAPTRRIGSASEAQEYFQLAALRKETVFLSYSGKDFELAQRISSELKKRFQNVFDYRDGESITPGQPWLQGIFDKLAGSAIGIPLLSESYLKSGNCMHEAQEMIAKRDSNQMAVVPVKLHRSELELPTWMRNVQYLDAADHPDAAVTVEKIVQSFDRGRPKSG